MGEDAEEKEGAREGGGGARSRSRGRGIGAMTAMESKGGVQHSDAMSDGTVRLSAAPAAVFGSMASTGQHSAKSADIGGSVTIATLAGRTHLSSSSSSSDSSSSSSAPNPPPKSTNRERRQGHQRKQGRRLQSHRFRGHQLLNHKLDQGHRLRGHRVRVRYVLLA